MYYRTQISFFQHALVEKQLYWLNQVTIVRIFFSEKFTQSFAKNAFPCVLTKASGDVRPIFKKKLTSSLLQISQDVISVIRF
jgi:hypothetical protein